jgi:hypothetical protein
VSFTGIASGTTVIPYVTPTTFPSDSATGGDLDDAAVCLAAGTPADLDTILARLDSAAVPHTVPAAGHPGLVVDVPDPDGHVIRIRTLL